MKSSLSYLLGSALVCLAALLALVLWYGSLQEKSTKVAMLQAQIDAKTETVTRIASARAALAEIAGDEAAVQDYFVPEAGVVPFIDDLEARGRAQGAAVTVSSVATDKSGTRPTLALTLKIKGSFEAVMRTVGSIEYAPYAISVSGLGLSLDSKGAWNADLTLSVGYVPAEAASAPQTP